MKNVALYLAIAAIAAGCASKETKTDAPVTDRSAGVSQPSGTASGSTATPAQQPSISSNPLRDPSNILSKRSVFFEYDSNAVKDEYRGLVQAHSRYMGDKRESKVRIEGNCDERGSREYNLALGQRRAVAAKRYLTDRGIDAGRIEIVSFGEERPTCTDEADSCWGRNRRDEFEITVGEITTVQTANSVR